MAQTQSLFTATEIRQQRNSKVGERRWKPREWSGPRTLSTWNSKGKDMGVEGVGKQEKTSCKIQPANIGPRRVRGWEHR